MSKDIPLVVSTVLDERTYRETRFDMTWDDVKKMLTPLVGDRTDKVLAMYRDEDTRASPFIINARIITDRSFRQSAFTMAERKAAQAASGGAPVWTYLWTTPSPAYGDRYGATHGIDVSPSMHDLRFPLLGPDANYVRLADQLAGAWVSLAATGNPNSPHAELARLGLQDAQHDGVWQPDNVVADPRRAFRELWAQRASTATRLGRSSASGRRCRLVRRAFDSAAPHHRVSASLRGCARDAATCRVRRTQRAVAPIMAPMATPIAPAAGYSS
jgi:para-nitrobenzyl esterase